MKKRALIKICFGLRSGLFISGVAAVWGLLMTQLVMAQNGGFGGDGYESAVPYAVDHQYQSVNFLENRRRREDAAALPDGVKKAEMTVDERQRSFLYYVPANRKAKPSIVLALHGGRGSGATFLGQTSPMLAHADRHGFILAYPDAIGNWNDGRANFIDMPSDVVFLQALIDWAAENFGADRSRVFLLGISNGGAMSYKMACDAAASVTAIAPIASSMSSGLYANCRPAGTVPVVTFNGTADPLSSYDGGKATSPLARFAKHGDTITGVEKTAEIWARVNGCGDGTSSENLPDRADDGTTVTLIKYHCPRDAVWIYRINDGGHSIPGMKGLGSSAERLIGKTSKDIDALVQAMAFFSRYGL